MLYGAPIDPKHGSDDYYSISDSNASGSHARAGRRTWRSWRTSSGPAAARRRSKSSTRKESSPRASASRKLIDPGTLFLEIGLLIAYDQYDGQAPAAGVVTGVARIEGRPCGDRRQRRHRESGRVVAGNDPQDSARAGNRHAEPPADRLPGRFGGRESSLSGRHFPGTVRRGADFLLQLADAPEAARAADRGGDGHVHRGRRVSARAFRRHHHGGGHQLHGAGRAEPGEGSRGPGGGRRIARRRGAAHARQRRGALCRQGRRASVSQIIREKIRELPEPAPQSQRLACPPNPPRAFTICCPPTIACPTTSKK